MCSVCLMSGDVIYPERKENCNSGVGKVILKQPFELQLEIFTAIKEILHLSYNYLYNNSTCLLIVYI